ncbi:MULTISPECIES: response regulator [unclassified Desulfovibrio]|uniref:response regulator n=1 Tax=unclassified Desulfovibrio TaxID=2593640 RepID=UPI0013ECF7C0|nr:MULTISPECIES: response regulator [unclassified Desulfovibrio]
MLHIPRHHGIFPALALVLILAWPTATEPATPSTSSGPNREVKAGIFNFEGYHSKDDEGNLEGYGMDLLRLLSEYSNLNFTFSGYDKSWQDMQEMLKNGDIDVVSTARRTPEREKIFTFSLPVGRNHTVLTRKLQNTHLRAGDYETYDGMRIGAVAGSSQNRYLPDFAKDKGFTYTLIEYESPSELSDALQKGDVDAILSSNLRKPYNETLLDIIKSDNFYIIARKENKDIIDEINHAIDQMNLNEGDWQNRLYYRHYGPDQPDQVEFSPREEEYRAAVKQGDKAITATARADNAPYSFVEDGELKGVIPEYFGRVMQVAGLPYTLVAPTAPGEAGENRAHALVMLDRLEPDRIGEDEPYHGFSTEPYLVTGVARVTRTDFNAPVRKLALPKGMPFDLPDGLLKNVETREYPTAQEALRAVQRGEADAAYVLPLTAQMFINRDPGGGLTYAILNDGGANFSIYVPASADHELGTILKKAVKGVPPATLNQLGSNYVSYRAGDMSLWHYLYANPGTMSVAACILMLAASLFLIMWLRGRWNRQLLTTTEHANQELASQLAIVEALSRDYSNVLAIDADKGSTGIIKLSGFGPGGTAESQGAERPYAELAGRYIDQKVHPEDRDYLRDALSLETIRRQLAEKEEYSGTYRIVEDGETQYFQFTFVRPHENGGRGYDLILAGFRNIDDMIRREQEQKQALAEALEKSRYASAAKTAFLNNMSHDIRTPMNAIIGFTALASSNADNVPMVQRYLGKIMTSGNHLLSLINDVLDMSRIESGKVKIEEQEVSLPSILHDLRTIVQADVRAKQLDFQIDTLNVVNETIFCDRLRLNQVLLNILSNAMKYTHPGGRVSVRVIQVTPAEDGRATYEFRVRDSGIGMSKEFLKHVFEPFEREQTTTVSGIQGTGLGLAITKNIVDMMGGSIEVESESGKGSEFAVTFTFRVVEEDTADMLLPQYEGTRALVVDDDINTCTSLSKMLSELGMKPDWTTLGKEALVRTEFAREQNEAYGAYFIDWIMADMNGIELTRRLRKTVPPEVPIIILTAYDWTDIEEEGKEAGVTAFCSKPIFLSGLRNVLLSPSQPEEEEHEEPTTPESFAGKRLLLAEDNEMNQEIAQMILENAGFELDIVENGQLAVAKVRDMPAGTYDLILMDVQMPVMDGYAATRAIRGLEDPIRSGIPIIAMTANAFDEDREEAINSGMNGYVAKPIDIKKLMETLDEFLRQR